jgi:hypothetical protein
MKNLKLKSTAAAVMLMLSGASFATGYEVWVSDQTNSAGISGTNNSGTHGGFLRVFDGAALDLDPNTATSTNLDTAALWPNALANTGSNAVRIHGMVPSPNHNYMAVSFVVSGHLGLVDARTKTAVALFRSTGTANGQYDGAGVAISGSTASGRQNHLTLWSPDGKYMLIANQNGKMLERVNVTWDNSGNITSAVLDAAASLDLVGGTGRITTQPVADASLPLGSVSGTVVDGQSRFSTDGVTYKQHATHRPNNVAICGGMASDNRTTFVTLGGGGLMAVDYSATPMKIVAIWDKSKISAAGCGAAESGGFTWLNAGVYASNVSSFVMYQMPTNWPTAAQGQYPVNVPKPKVIYQDPTQGQTIAPNNAISGNNRDAHGFGLTASRTYLHQFDRVRNNVEVFHAGTGARNTYSLTTENVCGTTQGANYDSTNPTVRVADGAPNAVSVSNDPSPDLLDLSPHGNRFYVALRGPNPLSVSHAAAGSCPGLGVVELAADGKTGKLTHVIPTSWLDNAGTTNISDPHAAIVRLKD